MEYKSILVPYDGSKHSQLALASAIKLVKGSPESKIIVLNVVPMAVAPTISEVDPVVGSTPTYIDYQDYEHLYDDSLTKLREKMINDIKKNVTTVEELPEEQIDYVTIAHPSAIQGIVGYCKDKECDLIVMGRRGLGPFRGMLGSVSYGVLRSVDIAVLTVK